MNLNTTDTDIQFSADGGNGGGSRGTDDVLADLGLPDAEELGTKAQLALKFNRITEQKGLTQVETARLTGLTQPKVSQLKRYQLQNISLERLMQALAALDQEVRIVVRPARGAREAGVRISA